MLVYLSVDSGVRQRPILNTPGPYNQSILFYYNKVLNIPCELRRIEMNGRQYQINIHLPAAFDQFRHFFLI